ncbi:MAG: hypothetical protein KBE04_06345 [Phycisphaerae bacterium]|nr:hypothetical protein [Phycisphaerae bacterium]
MDFRIAALVCLVALSTLCLGGPAMAQVDSRPIEAARSKTVLEPGDLQVIDEFVAAVVRDIVRTRDFSQVSKARAALATKKGMQAQYVQQFSQSCRKSIESGLQQAAGLAEDRRFKVTLNLLVLISDLQDPGLADLALPYLGDPNRALQYWAVQVVTHPAVAAKIKQGDWPVGAQILARLQQSIRSGSTATWVPVAEFAAQLGTAEGLSLLTEVADLRLAQYAGGQVQDPPQIDTTLLRLLCASVAAENGKNPAITGRFAQLYSYVIQHLAKVYPVLSGPSRQAWVSVVAEVEEKCIAPALGGTDMPLRRALEKGDVAALLSEHHALLGTPAAPGRLAAKWPFDYGAGPDGKVQTGPRDLPK